MKNASKDGKTKITPKPGETWECTLSKPNCMFFYEKDGELWGCWLGLPWGAKKIEEEIVDGQDGWRRVYSPK